MNQNNKPWSTVIENYLRFSFENEQKVELIKKQLEQNYPSIIIKSKGNLLFLRQTQCCDSIRMDIIKYGGVVTG